MRYIYLLLFLCSCFPDNYSKEEFNTQPVTGHCKRFVQNRYSQDRNIELTDEVLVIQW